MEISLKCSWKIANFRRSDRLQRRERQQSIRSASVRPCRSRKFAGQFRTSASWRLCAGRVGGSSRAFKWLAVPEEQLPIEQKPNSGIVKARNSVGRMLGHRGRPPPGQGCTI